MGITLKPAKPVELQGKETWLLVTFHLLFDLEQVD